MLLIIIVIMILFSLLILCKGNMNELSGNVLYGIYPPRTFLFLYIIRTCDQYDCIICTKSRKMCKIVSFQRK